MNGKKVKKILIEKDIEQKQLATAVGVSEAYMSLILKGQRNPSVRILKKIADYLGFSVDELLDEAA